MENQRDDRGDLPRPDTSLFRGPPAYIPRTPWGAGWALLAVAAIIALSIGLGLVLMGLIAGSTDLGFSGAPSGDGIGAQGLRFFALWQVAAVLLTLLASTFFGGRMREVLALQPAAGGWQSYAGALGVLVLLQVALSAVQYATREGDLYIDLRPFVDLVRGQNWLVAAAVIGIGAPLSEEVLFRGFLLAALAKTRLGFLGGAVISSALWTALHAGYSAAGIFEVFAIGLFFSWLLWRTGSLRVPIFCHAVYNSLIVLALRFVDLPTAA